MARNPPRADGDEGSAPIEFIFASVVLLIPLVYLVLALAQLQAGAYATNAAAIDAARTASRFPDSAAERAEVLARMRFEDFGVDAASWSIEFDCDDDCSSAGDAVTAHVSTEVPVLGLPVLFGGASPHLTVRASHTDIIAPYYGGGTGG